MSTHIFRNLEQNSIDLEPAAGHQLINRLTRYHFLKVIMGDEGVGFVYMGRALIGAYYALEMLETCFRM
jgi:hypothetical protein